MSVSGRFRHFLYDNKGSSRQTLAPTSTIFWGWVGIGSFFALQRKTPHLIDPFLGFRNLPDQQEIFYSRADGHLLRDQDHART